MAELAAYNDLMELMLLIDNDTPETPRVTLKLKDFASFVAVGGPEVRQKMIDTGAYTIITKAWMGCCSSGVEDVPSPSPGASACRDAVLQALYVLTSGFPEIIDPVGWQIISQALDKTEGEETQILLLKLIRNISIKSEENREYFTWSLGWIDSLVSFIATERPSCALLREWCSAVKALVLSDDIRVTYNRAPERKRVIARTKILPILAGHLHHQEYENDEGTLNAMVVLLGTMSVSDDMCIHIDSGNVLPGIHAIFKGHFHNKTLVRNSIAFLRYLCTNPQIREKCSNYVLMKWVVELIQYYKKDADVVDVGMSCCAFMTLENACQSGQLVAKNGLTLIFQIMNEFKEDVTILKGACVTLRNVCENGDDEVKNKLKEIGYPSLLIQIMINLPELKEFHVKPVLNELGVSENVEKVEEEIPAEEEEEEAAATPGQPETPIQELYNGFDLEGEMEE